MLERAKWVRETSSIEYSSEEPEMVEKWKCQYGKIEYIAKIRLFMSNWGIAKLVSIAKYSKINKNDKEPNMSEKNAILSGLDIIENYEVALEIFPKKSKIVDKIDMYHLWIIRKVDFPYYIQNKISSFLTRWREVEVNGKKMLFKKRTIKNGLTNSDVFFIKSKDNKELTWYEKQNFKDSVIGEDVIAVEYICETEQNIAMLTCIPEIVFGLK